MEIHLAPEEYHTVHLIGIGGISMSGIACILQNMGFAVQGSDQSSTPLTEKLRKRGIKCIRGHRAENITGAELVVYTAAIPAANPELIAAREQGLPVLERSAFLGLLMDRYQRSIAVAGAHGKTTTTSMIATTLVKGMLDPTILVGGELDTIGGNFRTGNSDIFVTEACEYVDSFLRLNPWLAVILNIDEDHLDYFLNIDNIKRSFRSFMEKVKPDGRLIVNGDHHHIKDMLGGLKPEIVTYGFSRSNRISADSIKPFPSGRVNYTLFFDGKKAGEMELNVPGQHNVLNSLAAIGVAQSLGLTIEQIHDGLSTFRGTRRRFEVKGNTLSGARIIDDYAHHPDEIEKTLAAASTLEYNQLWVIFQPHLYSRTRQFLDNFARVLSKAPNLIITDIYGARESNDGSVSSADLTCRIQEMGGNALYIPSLEEAIAFLGNHLGAGDLLLTLGAGDVYKVGDELVS
ncbi:MAG: UDP-N-acetylmuramate--L-alanine ligase [Halanaerobium sp.]|nr:UDP-N-acetylmuramate--L-alanine ligase [Halanaerobium sp.]